MRASGVTDPGSSGWGGPARLGWAALLAVCGPGQARGAGERRAERLRRQGVSAPNRERGRGQRRRGEGRAGRAGEREPLPPRASRGAQAAGPTLPTAGTEMKGHEPGARPLRRLDSPPPGFSGLSGLARPWSDNSGQNLGHLLSAALQPIGVPAPAAYPKLCPIFPQEAGLPSGMCSLLLDLQLPPNNLAGASRESQKRLAVSLKRAQCSFPKGGAIYLNPLR